MSATDTATPPVTEQPKAPATQQTEQPNKESRRFPARRPLSEVAREKMEPAKPEAKKEPEKKEESAKATPEAKEKAQEAPKAPADTKTTPETKSGSIRASLAQGEAVDEKAKETPASDETVEDDDDPTLTEKMRKRVNKLKGETAKERTAREAAEKKATELEGRLAELQSKPQLTDAQKKEWETKDEELMRLRRRYSLESDPEVKKYDTRIAATAKVITDTVASSNLPDWLKEEVKKLGGIENLARSDKEYRLKAAKEGEKDEMVSGAELYRRALHAMNPMDADQIRVAIAEQKRIQAEKGNFIEEESKKAKDYFDKEAQSKAEQSKQIEAAQAQQVQLFKGVQERILKEKWLQDEEVPTTGDDSAIKATKSRNALRPKLRQLVEETISFKSEDPKEVADFYFQVTRDAAKVYYAEHELKLSQARIKELETELDGIKNASRTTPRNGSGAAAPAVSSTVKVPPREQGEGNLAYGMRLQRAGVPEADRLAALRGR